MSHPAQVVSDAIAAIESQDWAAFIALCDPVSMRRFKRDLVWQFADKGFSPAITVEELLEDSPDTPRAVAEWQLAQMEAMRDPLTRLQLEISKVSSVAELEGLEPEDALLRWLQSRMPQHSEGFTTRKWSPVGGMEVVEFVRDPEESADPIRFPIPDCAVLGSVRDGEDFAQVVCRQAFSSASDEDDVDLSVPADEAELDRQISRRAMIHTVACRRQADDSWRLVADRNLFFLAHLTVLDSEPTD